MEDTIQMASISGGPYRSGVYLYPGQSFCIGDGCTGRAEYPATDPDKAPAYCSRCYERLFPWEEPEAMRLRRLELEDAASAVSAERYDRRQAKAAARKGSKGRVEGVSRGKEGAADEFAIAMRGRPQKGSEGLL